MWERLSEVPECKSVLALWGALKVSVTASFRGVGVSELTTAAAVVSSDLT
jgi:hypothetical protein